jgi:hypothetical protein
MTKKFNLSVSDELAEKIEARREYLGNLSALFQEAVTEKIQRQEEFERRLQGDVDMQAVIERLKQEKMDVEGDYREQGQEAGLAWAKAASYADLKYVVYLDLNWPLMSVSSRSVKAMDEVILGDKVLGNYFRGMLKNNPPISPLRDGSERLSSFPQEWIWGWREGIKEFWREIAGQV